ncbi:MAG TPA: hypothetical protein VFR27_16270 [Mycobacterium sp.]|nr:hypothetical protein [Mycobacterium sp.]
MAFTFTRRLVTAFRERLRTRRADRYPSRMPVAMVTASLGGHPLQVASPYR